MIAVEAEVDQIDEMKLFSEKLARMIRFQYTHEDLDFCNTRRPVGYVPYLLQQLLKERGHGFSLALKTDLGYLIERWAQEPNYIPLCQDMPTSVYSQKAARLLREFTTQPHLYDWSNACTLEINSITNFDSHDLTAQILKQADTFFFTAKTLKIHINENMSPDVLIKLPRYLSVIMTLMSRDVIMIDYAHFPHGLDCTRFLMLSNLFRVRISLSQKNLESNFQPVVVKRLLKLRSDDAFVRACLKRSDQKELLSPLLKLNRYLSRRNANLEDTNRFILTNYDNNQGVNYFAHKHRMKEVAEICREGLQTIERSYFSWYFQSVTALIQLCSQIDVALVDEIFNDALICDDLQVVILTMQNNNFPLFSFLDDENLVFPNRTGWEALLVARLKDELENNPIVYANALGLMKNQMREGCLAELAVQLFKVVVSNMKQERDKTILMDTSQRLIDFLIAQKKLSQSFNMPLKHLFVILLAQAQQQGSHFIYLLRDYSEELIRLDAVGIFDDMLNVLTRPKNKRDTENNYYSILALARILCLMMNSESIISHVIRIEAMPEVREPIYRRYLQLYANHYSQLLIERYKADPNMVYAYDVLKLYQFQKSEGFKVVSHEVVAETLAFAISKMNTDHDADTDHFLIVQALPDYYSYDYIIELYIRFRSQLDLYFVQISEALFSVIMAPKNNEESQKNYLDRISAIIMLVVKYALPLNLCYYYLPLMGHQGGSDAEFNNLIRERPAIYAEAIICVYQQFNKYFAATPLPRHFLLEGLEVCGEAIIHNGPFSEVYNQILQRLFTSLPIDEANAVILNLSANNFKVLMSVYAAHFFEKFRNSEFPYNTLHDLLTSVNFSCMRDFNVLLDDRSTDNYNIEFWRLLLHVGADPLYCAMPDAENKICPLLRSIQGNSNFMSVVCCAIKENSYKLDFEKLHTMCHDPLGLAVKSGASAEKVQLMIDVGFDVMRYDYDPPETIKNIAAHILISQRQGQLFREQRRRIAADMRLGFIQPAVNSATVDQKSELGQNSL